MQIKTLALKLWPLKTIGFLWSWWTSVPSYRILEVAIWPTRSGHTEGQTDGQRNTITRPVKDGRIRTNVKRLCKKYIWNPFIYRSYNQYTSALGFRVDNDMLTNINMSTKQRISYACVSFKHCVFYSSYYIVMHISLWNNSPGYWCSERKFSIHGNRNLEHASTVLEYSQIHVALFLY